MPSKNVKKSIRSNSLKDDIGSLMEDDSWMDDDGGFTAAINDVLDTVVPNKIEAQGDSFNNSDVQAIIISKENEYQKELTELKETNAKYQEATFSAQSKGSLVDHSKKQSSEMNRQPEQSNTAKQKSNSEVPNPGNIIKLMALMNEITTDGRRVLTEILAQTDYGKIENVKIPRTRFVYELSVNTSKLKSAKIELENKGILLVTPSDWRTAKTSRPHLYTLTL